MPHQVQLGTRSWHLQRVKLRQPSCRDGGAEALVVKTIQSEKKSIRLAAYSFASPAVVRAHLEAKRRGVDVMVVVDRKSNPGAVGS